MAKKHINLIITGSSKAEKGLDLYYALIRKGYDVVIYATENSKKFVDLGDLKVGNETEILNRTSFQELHYPSHFSVADEADLTIVYPSTILFMNRVAVGVPDEYCSTLVSHTLTPVVFAPAGFGRVYNNVATKRNVDWIKSNSAPDWYVIDPIIENIDVVSEDYYTLPNPDETIKFIEKILK